MLKKSLYRQTLLVGLFLLSGCEVAHNAQRDFTRLVSSNPFSSNTAQAAPGQTRVATGTPKPAVTKPDDPRPDAPQQASVTPTAPSAPPANINLVGKSEGQVRALLGPPTSVEERAPGKTWHYRDGRCSVDVQLYPDVQTRQFGTLAYEVKSDDNSDEGRRDCLARFRSRAQPGSG
jgi:hypothetical protein